MILYLTFHPTLSLNVKVTEIFFLKDSYQVDFFSVFRFFNLTVKQLRRTKYIFQLFI